MLTTIPRHRPARNVCLFRVELFDRHVSRAIPYRARERVSGRGDHRKEEASDEADHDEGRHPTSTIVEKAPSGTGFGERCLGRTDLASEAEREQDEHEKRNVAAVRRAIAVSRFVFLYSGRTKRRPPPHSDQPFRNTNHDEAEPAVAEAVQVPLKVRQCQWPVK